MSRFKYKIRNSNGRLIESTIEAESMKAARQLILKNDQILLDIAEVQESRDILAEIETWHALRKLDLNDLILFNRQMYRLSKAGVPLIRSLRSLADSARNSYFKTVLNDMCRGLESGSDLAKTMRGHPSVFSPLLVSIIHVGESSGDLDQAFLQIAQYLEREKTTRNRIKAALRYPMMVIAAIAIAMIIINIYVIPAFKTVFDKLNKDLPWQTQFLINISDFTVNYWPFIVVGVIVTVAIFIKFIRTDSGRLMWDHFVLRIPVIGSLLERAIMERFARSFSMILNSGTPLIHGIQLIASSVGNRYVGTKLNEMRLGIEKGDSISRMARASQMFPPLVVQMILIGEETGNIGDMLVDVADYYEAEIDVELNNLASAIEPILIVIIGIMVLIMALGIFLPMWNLSSAMH